ncbi:hypothetical protein PRUPE_5G213700 [Prunus persica]|uniref:F-box domain-containing protein n=2 Tax=Prunus persica TaxID=3760 RepID=A0A251PBT7_PRUPE|nr:hypothetical protein PRUPE_5G213700 [Prunus persica]
MENRKAPVSEGVEQKVKDQDNLWNLPNDILDQILSLLPLKEAVATSVLSSKWRYVWTSCLVLDFDFEKNMKPLTHCSHYQDQDFEDKECWRYVNWVDSVVKMHTGPTIEKFRVCFPLDLSFTPFIDRWVQFALKKWVQDLVLDFSAQSHKLLHLGNGFSKASGFSKFRALKNLSLNSIGVTRGDIGFVLSTCPCLEKLKVSNCRNLTSVTIVGSHFALKLKSLAIECWHSMDSIEILDANIVSFSYSGNPLKLVLSNVPLLVVVSISERDNILTDDYRGLIFNQLSGCLSQLHTLGLDLNGMVDMEVFSVQTLPNIKHLELEVLGEDILILEQINCFMKACSYLEKLVLKMQFIFPEVNLKEASNTCSHHHLEVVEIVGYRGRQSAVKILMLLMETAVSLKKVVINPVRQLIRGESVDESDEVVEEEEARRHALHELRREVPAAIIFGCL